MIEAAEVQRTLEACAGKAVAVRQMVFEIRQPLRAGASDSSSA
jgi:hypothetical protein